MIDKTGDKPLEEQAGGKAGSIAPAAGPVLEPLERRVLLDAFPFSIDGAQFLRDGSPTFLNVLSYQPLEPGQPITGEIREARVQEDLRRWAEYAVGSDTVALRVYAQPTATYPVRMPQSFYDGLRDLDMWVIRDIYFGSLDVAAGRTAIDAVIAETEAVGGFDRVIAFEIGNEFAAGPGMSVGQIESFISTMAAHIKARMAEPGREGFSDWVTWASWPPADVLRTDGPRIVPAGLDYRSYNAYSYEPYRIRYHQAGPGTGSPYAGYLAALAEYHPGVPVVIAETGLADSPSIHPNHAQFAPWAPQYRKGGLAGEQVAEGLADRYWDARLSGSVAGIGFFEWNDEWHKTGQPAVRNDDPEEYFGLLRFDAGAAPGTYEARSKFQQETIRELYSLSHTTGSVTLSADDASVGPDATTTVRATVPPGLTGPLRYRWEVDRGVVVGQGDTAEFYAGGQALGDATVTVVVIDAAGQAGIASTTVAVEPPAGPGIEILTLGTGVASGRVSNVDLDQYKLASWIEIGGARYVQPYTDMTSLWVGPDGYWWTEFHNAGAGKLCMYLVPQSYQPVGLPFDTPPPGNVAGAALAGINDSDNDLLLDSWEIATFTHLDVTGFDDSDGDGANNLDEHLTGGSATVANDDSDGDGLFDYWERLYFGRLSFDGAADPDGDGLDNETEEGLATHPGRASTDADRDGLPDAWELRRLGSRLLEPGDTLRPGRTALDFYELAAPVLPGDATTDGKVDVFDLARLANNYGGPGEWCEADFNDDGVVNVHDLAVLANNYGRVDPLPELWPPVAGGLTGPAEGGGQVVSVEASGLVSAFTAPEAGGGEAPRAVAVVDVVEVALPPADDADRPDGASSDSPGSVAVSAPAPASLELDVDLLAGPPLAVLRPDGPRQLF